MAAFDRHGVDRMIDLEHLSLDQESESFDPDARGWARLELRDGELWAVDVKWTEDGARRLAEKTQRFISPTFFFDDDGRVTKILNIALTAMPATHDIAPLVAARVQTSGEQVKLQANKMTPEQAAMALEVVEAGDGAGALELVRALIASMLGGDDSAEPAEEEAPPVDGEELADEEHPEEMADEEHPPRGDSEGTAEVIAATARLLRLTNRKSLGEALDEVEVMRQSHINLSDREQKLAKEEAALELGERKRIAKRHTELGVATPHTTGLNGKATDKDGKRVPLTWRYLHTPLTELKSELKSLEDAAGKNALSTRTGVSTPTSSGKNPYGLTDSEMAACEAYKCEPKMFAELKQRGEQEN